MTIPRMVELAAAALLVGLGIYLYRRREAQDNYGSQGAVILFVIAMIMGIHALGGLDYHPTSSEADFLGRQAR